MRIALKFRYLSIAALAAVAVAAPAHAQSGLQDLGQIDVMVAAAMGAEIGQPGGARAPVDRRLKLKACPGPLEVSGPEMNAAAVRCNAIGWRIRVPLMLSAAPTSNINVGSRGRQVPGQEAVKRGEPILLTVERPTFTLTRVMVADKDGNVGDVIPVREGPREKAIFVRITEPGKATILGY
jgi:flagella basal body P-ring formation protein FlgA